MSKTAVVFGASGQDGSFLCDLLLSKGYIVYGMVRRSSSPNLARLEHIINNEQYNHRFHLSYGDLTDTSSVYQMLEYWPDECYSLAAQSHVKISFDIPKYTLEVGVIGTLNVLEAVRKCSPNTRVYIAGSSEQFGSSPPPQNEGTPFRPRSPYAVAKVAAYNLAVNYREAYELFICNGILLNHESERRGINFVTRKIVRAAVDIKSGRSDSIYLGNIYSKRDWGYAPDYVYGQWLMLQHDVPDDYVLATGEMHSVEEFAVAVFKYLDLDFYKYYHIDPKHFRPTEVDALCGDATKAAQVLGWAPRVTFDDLVKIMIEAELNGTAV